MRQHFSPYFSLRVAGLVLLALAFSVLIGRSAGDEAKPAGDTAAPAATPDWAMNATIIEACSCPMFCQCYFNAQPASHPPGCGGMGPGCAMGAAASGGTQRYCRFNNAFRVNSGHYDQTALDGAKFWLGGDLGADFSRGELDWSVVIFDPAVTKAQREGITAILGPLYPAKWKSLTVGRDGAIEWKATKERAEALLDGGKGGKVILNRVGGMKDEPVVIKNLTYWGAPRNDGFILMTNEVEGLSAVPEGKKPFEFKGTNGFMITVDINSKDVKAAEKPKGAGY